MHFFLCRVLLFQYPTLHTRERPQNQNPRKASEIIDSFTITMYIHLQYLLYIFALHSWLGLLTEVRGQEGSHESLKYWRPMTYLEFSSWYPKPADRCQLKLGPNVTQYQVRSACMSYRKKNNYPHTLQCGPDSFGIGLGYKHNCVAPMRGRRTFFDSVLIGFENASRTDLYDLLQRLAVEDRSLVVLGDSLSYQTVYTLPCELYREKVKFHISGNTFIPMQGYGNYTIHLEDMRAAVDIHYMRLDNIRLLHQMKDVKSEFDLIYAKGKKGMVILTNIGLNYNDMGEYKTDMPKYFQWLYELATDRVYSNTVVWRETTAAHWSFSRNGYFNHTARSELTLLEAYCAPHREGAVDHRNDIAKVAYLAAVLKSSSSNGSSNNYRRATEEILRGRAATGGKMYFPVHYVPYYFVTQELWNMHTDFPPYPGGHSDCVHYCYHPILWQPLWKALADIAIRNVVFNTPLR